MTEQQAHETFSETPASPDEPQPTVTPVPDVTPTEDTLNVAAPLVIQPISSSQEEAELEVIGTVAGDEGDVSEMTGEEIAVAKRKTKHKKKKPKERKKTKDEKKTPAAETPKEGRKKESAKKTSTEVKKKTTVEGAPTTSQILQQLKKDHHQQLCDEDIDPDTPIVGASTSQGLDNLFNSDDLPGAWQKSPSKEEGEDEDEEPEAPPPISHRALEKATLVSSETTHTTPTD